MKTTAQYRAEAKDHEDHLRWAKAAKCWEMAIKAYPNPVGALAKFDILKMTGRMNDSKDAAARKEREGTAVWEVAKKRGICKMCSGQIMPGQNVFVVKKRRAGHGPGMYCDNLQCADIVYGDILYGSSGGRM